MEALERLWQSVYGDDDRSRNFFAQLEEILLDEQKHMSMIGNEDQLWYQDAVIYSTYGDMFNRNLKGLIDKLDYIKDLGANCLWLLPILDSPMKDAGFDISDYQKVRRDLVPYDRWDDPNGVVKDLMEEAHKRGIRVIFDIAMNHCSIEHEWFKKGRNSDSPYHDYFIWAKDDRGYDKARIIFKGICDSNWKYDEEAGAYFFHRFFDVQPDLNYRNPKVLIEMIQVLIYWRKLGIDGFRMDAVPYLWKEEGTTCENLPHTHNIVKIFRAVLDFVAPGTLLLAEACQQPEEVVDYFGDGDECHGAYHFPVMPRLFSAMAMEDKTPVEMVMSHSFTPDIPDLAQWFMFLRCHDELTLEMVTEEERHFIYHHYAMDQTWDFRQGEGISARLADLLRRDPDKIALAFSLMFTLMGTPIIYYGDEFAWGNNVKYYHKTVKETGYKDSRYLVRGPLDWDRIEKQLADPESLAHKTYENVKEMIAVRKAHLAFSRGRLEFVDMLDHIKLNSEQVMGYRRIYGDETISVYHNFSHQPRVLSDVYDLDHEEMIFKHKVSVDGSHVTLGSHGFFYTKKK